MDETHVIYDMNCKKCLFLRGRRIAVRYMDVVPDAEGFTVVFGIIGGVEARIANPFFSFMKLNRNYIVQGLPEDNRSV